MFTNLIPIKKTFWYLGYSVLFSTFTSNAVNAQCGNTNVDKILKTQTEVDDFGVFLNQDNCNSYLGNIVIFDDNDGLDNILDLSPLNELTEVVGFLSIRSNTSLPNLEGLSNLISIGNSFTIGSNILIINLDQLSSLTSIGETFMLNNNANLINIDGLSNLTSIGDFLDISSNPLLTDLNGLNNLIFVDRGLSLFRNDKVGENGLQDFCGLFQLLSNGFLGTYSVTENSLNPSQLEITNNGPCTTCDGTFIFNSQCYPTLADAIADASGTGTVQINGNADNTSLNTIPSGLTIEVKEGVTWTNSSDIINNGTITLVGTAQFINDTDGTYRGGGAFNGDFVNNGTINVGAEE